MKTGTDHFTMKLAVAVIAALVGSGTGFAQGPQVQIVSPLPLPVQEAIQPFQAELCTRSLEEGPCAAPYVPPLQFQLTASSL
jgi:hypothetical protein